MLLAGRSPLITDLWREWRPGGRTARCQIRPPPGTSVSPLSFPHHFTFPAKRIIKFYDSISPLVMIYDHPFCRVPDTAYSGLAYLTIVLSQSLIMQARPRRDPCRKKKIGTRYPSIPQAPDVRGTACSLGSRDPPDIAKSDLLLSKPIIRPGSMRLDSVQKEVTKK